MGIWFGLLPTVINLLFYGHASTVELNNLNFHPLEDVCRYRDPHLQVGKNYSYLFNLEPNICKS